MGTPPEPTDGDQSAGFAAAGGLARTRTAAVSGSSPSAVVGQPGFLAWTGLGRRPGGGDRPGAATGTRRRKCDASFAAIRSPQHEVLWTVARAADGQLHVSNLRPMTIPPGPELSAVAEDRRRAASHAGRVTRRRQRPHFGDACGFGAPGPGRRIVGHHAARRHGSPAPGPTLFQGRWQAL